MALDGTYAGLCASVALWLDRSDLAAGIPDFIALAEASLNDRLRFAAMERTTLLTPASVVSGANGMLVDENTGLPLSDEVSGALLAFTDDIGSLTGTTPVISITTLPADYLEMRVLVASTTPKRELKLAAPGWARTALDMCGGYPEVYTIIGDTIGIYPPTSAALAMTYYAKIPSLSDINTTNWLLTRYPNIYLFGALAEAAGFLYDDNRVGGWDARQDAAITRAQLADMGSRWGNATMQLSGPTP